MKHFPSRLFVLTTFLLLSQPRPALAGMPSIDLTDVAKLRVDAISFFVLLGFLSALGVKLIWNSFRKEFPNLPRLTYGKALGLTTLWGLLFLIVLTMISGARELMTPGAWVKQGYTYQLASNSKLSLQETEVSQLRQQRESRIKNLARALLAHAASHGGKYPEKSEEIAEELWRTDDSTNTRYEYTPGLSTNDKEKILVYEPAIYGDKRFILRGDGQILEEEWQKGLDPVAGGKSP